VAGLSFVVQARIRVLDLHKEVLADSGSPQPTDVSVGGVAWNVKVTQPAKQPIDRLTFFAITKRPISMTDNLPVTIPLLDPVTGTDEHVLVYTSIPVAGPTFGLGFKEVAAAESGGRSDQIVDLPLIDSSGDLQGYVELSDGPAYGSEIGKSVAWAWALAGSIAVALAALIGWLVSRRISQPIVALTDVTTAMSAGDLSQRAHVAGRDEIGTLARSFNEMADQVEETITALRRFVSDAAHELHSPLTALQTDLELSAGERDEARRTALIEQAQQQTIRLRELADSLLDLSRVEAAGQASFVAVNINDLLRDLGEPYASQADQAGLTFSLEVPPDPIELRGNPAQLRRAIGNLVDNAIKFTPEGGAVTISLRKTMDTIELCVQDTGIGVPEDDLPQLFNRFHRGRNVANYPGNGLGLAIVKAIVDAHGGSVSATNISPGSRFCILLPEAR
jgi:signal transduction histidine kinase